MIGSYSYDPTGIPRDTVENTTMAGYNIHRYHGGLLDKTTGLIRFGVRWYDLATARFTPDPSGKEKNTYLYAGGNTCNQTDPSGECSLDSFAATAGTVFSGLGVGMDLMGKGATLAWLGLETTPVGWAATATAFGVIGLGLGLYCMAT